MAFELDDVDWAKVSAKVQRALVQGRLKSPKTYAGRRNLFLLTPAREALEEQRKLALARGKLKKHSLAFWNPNSGGQWSYKSIRKV